MKSVKVTYTTTTEFAAQNAANIQRVMSDLRALNDPGIFYFAVTGADGKTFSHIAFFNREEDQKTLFALPSFQEFQVQLKASEPETPPQTESLNLVASSKPMFAPSL
jgi:hypothetical protein